MTHEQRLRFIQAVERAGYHIEATEDRDVMILTVWGALRHVARSISPNRYDWEEIARQFYTFQQRGSKRYITKKAA